jgi:DNA invertase Pin-like site-specific DNA recombinase
VIARLDRFSRRVSIIARIMEEGVKLAVAELPHATDFQLHIFAALAQEERRLIFERTTAALAEAKRRGRVLGANGRVLAGQNRSDAVVFAQLLEPILDEIGRGLPYSYIAERLNQQGYRTRRGSLFCAQSVKGVSEFRARYGCSEGPAAFELTRSQTCRFAGNALQLLSDDGSPLRPS